MLQPNPIDVHFVKHGGHFGAFGAMMNGVKKFTIDRKNGTATENGAAKEDGADS